MDGAEQAWRNHLERKFTSNDASNSNSARVYYTQNNKGVYLEAYAQGVKDERDEEVWCQHCGRSINKAECQECAKILSGIKTHNQEAAEK